MSVGAVTWKVRVPTVSTASPPTVQPTTPTPTQDTVTSPPPIGSRSGVASAERIPGVLVAAALTRTPWQKSCPPVRPSTTTVLQPVASTSSTSLVGNRDRLQGPTVALQH